MKPETAAKLSNLSGIYIAAKRLHDHGLLPDEPAKYVRDYIEANPDINEALPNYMKQSN